MSLIHLNSELIDFKYVNSDIVEPLYYAITEFESEKKIIGFIKKVEGIVRRSTEYTKLIKYIREELELNNCSIMNDVTSDEALIELHHAPFTLFDIVEAALNHRLENRIPITTLSLAEEVIIYHYEGIVGLIQLTKTMHDLVHSKRVSISPEMIIGKYDVFFKRFEKYLSDAAKLKYMELAEHAGTRYDVNKLIDENKIREDEEKKHMINVFLQDKIEKRELANDLNS